MGWSTSQKEDTKIDLIIRVGGGGLVCNNQPFPIALSQYSNIGSFEYF